MSVSQIKRMVNYSGLAFGQGPLTSSTSPLWSPHGAYSYGAIEMGGAHMGAIHANPAHMGAIHANPAHMGAIHANPAHMGAIHANPVHMGAIEMGALHANPYGMFYGEADGSEDQSMMDKAKAFFQKETFGVQNLYLALGGIGLLYLFRGKVPFLKKNPWSGDPDGHKGAALARWAMHFDDPVRAKEALKLLDGRTVKHPKRRGKVKTKKGRMAGYALQASRRLVGKSAMPTTVKKLKTALKGQKGLSKMNKAELENLWEQTFGDLVANPKRRKVRRKAKSTAKRKTRRTMRKRRNRR